MPFRLPPPWDPGFALPSNVKDEGLERRAFVTKQARRGTYDNPSVGSGGYVLPTYVKEEGYGRGVYTTGWMPSGSTPGGKVPHYLNQRPQVLATAPTKGGGTAFTIGRQSAGVAVPGPSAVPIPPAYKNYGDRVATAIVKKMAKLPEGLRASQLKQTLDVIDPKIHSRAMKAAAASGKRGVAALHAGLSHAVSTTLLEQVVATGKSGKRPTRGLMAKAACTDCGSPAAMGSLASIAPALTSRALLATFTSRLIPDARTGPGGITPGTCDSSGKYIWDAGGFWRGKMSKETCLSVNTGVTMSVANHRGSSNLPGANEGGVVALNPDGSVAPINTKSRPTVTPGTTKVLKVGPFTFPDVDKVNVHWSGLLPADWRAAINGQITHDCHPCIESSMRDSTKGAYAVLRNFLGPEMPAKFNHDFFGLRLGPGVSVPDDAADPSQPLVTADHPVSGDTYALYAYVQPRDEKKPFDANTNPFMLRLEWKKADEGFWSWIWHVIVEVVDWTVDVVEEIGSLTCDLLKSQAGQVGAVAAGAAIGGPGGAQAGAVGAQVGAQLCAQPPPPTTAVKHSALVPLAILGASVAAAVMLTKKKAP